ncbi:MAG: hypothetical protein DCC49_03445 [Acidobacteria bacterium]|nr:MAG: hypothetical protein DCC49_03445 [Acidobacteriota bacterium]
MCFREAAVRIYSTFLALLLAVVLMITAAGIAAAEDTPVPVRQSQPELYKVMSPPWGEAGPAVVFTADDGYRDTPTENGNTVDFFQVLDDKGVKGTFFWPPGFTYDNCAPENSNWGLDEADVLAIAQSGHEIGTHGWCHENYAVTAAASETALEEILHAAQSKIYEKTGITPTTGAYPVGAQNERVRQIVSRSHDFYRGSLCCVVSSPPDPYRVETFDPVQASLTDNALSLAAAKDMVRQAVSQRTAVVFLFHSSQDSYSNHNRENYVWDVFPPLIDWLQDSGPTGAQAEFGLSAPIPILPFKDMMMRRAAKRGASSMEDTSGHAYYSGLRSQSVEVIRDDEFGDHFWMDYDTHDVRVTVSGVGLTRYL